MKFRTVTRGLPQTYKRIARKHVDARQYASPHTQPVTTLGDFMQSGLHWLLTNDKNDDLEE